MTGIRGFPARWPTGSRPNIQRYPLAGSQTFKAGDLVHLTSGVVAEVSGADPTPLLGLAAEDSTGVVETGYVMVSVFDDATLFRLQGTTPYVEATHLGNEYAIVESSGIYLVDVDDATTNNHRVQIMDGSTGRESDLSDHFYIAKVLTAHRQLG